MSCHPAAAIGRPPRSVAAPRLGDPEPARFPERCAAPVTPLLSPGSTRTLMIQIPCWPVIV